MKPVLAWLWRRLRCRSALVAITATTTAIRHAGDLSTLRSRTQLLVAHVGWITSAPAAAARMGVGAILRAIPSCAS